jgi:hypothetical protein
MPKYLVLYRSSVSPDAMTNMTPEQAQAGMEAWMQWAGKAGSALVDLGSPIAPVASVGSGEAGGLPVCGFSVMEAASGDDVAKLLQDHPHLQTPGDAAIEVLEYLPIPGA